MRVHSWDGGTLEAPEAHIRFLEEYAFDTSRVPAHWMNEAAAQGSSLRIDRESKFIHTRFRDRDLILRRIGQRAHDVGKQAALLNRNPAIVYDILKAIECAHTFGWRDIFRSKKVGVNDSESEREINIFANHRLEPIEDTGKIALRLRTIHRYVPKHDSPILIELQEERPCIVSGQWLGLRKVGANPPAKNLYPQYDRHLEISIVRETEGFFTEILRHDLDVRNFLKSDFLTINERLARFYDIPGVKGDAIRRVPAPPGAHRGGLVTQASIQSITSNGTRTSPVVRGVWMLRTLLGSDPGLPVANVGEIASKVPGIDKATVRQRLAIHREAASCARCHDKIDPLGLALENYDACGGWRDQEGHGYEGRIEKDDPLIDASAKMPDGTDFKGVEGLQTQLLKKEDLFLTALASQLYTYGLGRELGFSDRPAVRASVEAMKRNKYMLRALLLTIVQSDLFTTK